MRSGSHTGIAAVILVAALSAAPGAAADVELQAGGQLLRIATEGGLPIQWVTCAARCDDVEAGRRLIVGADNGVMRWTADRPGDAETMARTIYDAEVSESADAVIAVLTSRDPVGAPPLVQRYELSRSGHSLEVRLQAPPGTALGVSTGPGFVPEQLPGFGAAFSGVDAVHVTASGQEPVDAAENTVAEIDVARSEWLGIRSRFWAWLASPSADATVVVGSRAENQPTVEWRMRGGELQLSFYAGPVEWKELRVVSAELPGLLFAALWEPLRWLCFGLYFLLGYIMATVGNEGLAIVLLSLAVKIILWPLTRVAERWQRDVNRIQSRIQPKIAAIRQQFRGEEAHKRTLDVYREEGVHTLFTMKSLAGFAIQVPMFIAAFDMLADNFALNGASFLWIEDLAAPDRLLALPVTLPFFGGYLNLLPVLMTLVTLLSALVQKDESLTPMLLARQRRQLYLMAGAFFLLFYTFPAGMVLYWTANNLWHLLKVQAARLIASR